MRAIHPELLNWHSLEVLCHDKRGIYLCQNGDRPKEQEPGDHWAT